jgi:hypothetical protein
MVDNDTVLRIIQERGPVVPTQLAKEMGQNSMIMGAVLSTLASQKKVMISSLKVGGSPLYYLPDQAQRLEEFTRYLKDQDRATQELLKERKVLREVDMTPLVRVSLRNIRDFAKPLEVTAGDHKEIFWKYYLVSEGEANKLIGDILDPKQPKEKDRKSAGGREEG